MVISGTVTNITRKKGPLRNFGERKSRGISSEIREIHESSEEMDGQFSVFGNMILKKNPEKCLRRIIRKIGEKRIG